MDDLFRPAHRLLFARLAMLHIDQLPQLLGPRRDLLRAAVSDRRRLLDHARMPYDLQFDLFSD